ncbi:RxLR effector protein [Phytophthora cinnamomi]|uniref:RxLR effector protein n=1 Tax=Phytophthora cinnamomi TaxID=4785 RepID=UPI0035595B6F|nr:RxLR effector protein [Phytophthora cinnamomi]
MRLSVFLLLVVATIAVSCNIVVTAEKATTGRRHLKGTQNDLDAEDEERGLSADLLAKMRAQGLIGAEKVATAGTKVDDVLNAVKAAEGKTTALTGAAKNWQKLSKAVESGAHLKKLDATNSKWKTAFTKLKDAGQIKGVTEAQAARLTEAAAKEMVKNPAKSSKFKKFLEITFGAALTALIIVGINSMIS